MTWWKAQVEVTGQRRVKSENDIIEPFDELDLTLFVEQDVNICLYLDLSC